MAKRVAFMFELHQPRRLRPRGPRALAERILAGPRASYDDELDSEVFARAADRCYEPATEILASAASSGFKFSFSASGTWLEQARARGPRVLELLGRAVDSGAEPIAQPYYHSVAPLMPDLDELAEQVAMHREAVEEAFGRRPTAAEATEMIYNNDIGSLLGGMGFSVVLTEGVERFLAGRSPNHVYESYGRGPRLLLRNYRLSDDVAFRFSNASWDQYPLTADKYADWIAASPGDVVFIAVDYETFGEHHRRESGILDFLARLPEELDRRGVRALTVSEAASSAPPLGAYDVPPWSTISWADVEKDASAWLGSELQVKAASAYEEAGAYAKAVGGELLAHWRYLGASDNFYYMSTKAGPSGEVHSYFSPYKSPLEAYTAFISALLQLQADVLREYLSSVAAHAWRLRAPRRLAFRAELPGGGVLELRDLLGLRSSLEAHPSAMGYYLARGDVQAWIRGVFLWDELAEELDEASQDPKRALRVLEASRPAGVKS